MEPDSTTYDNNPKTYTDGPSLPFLTSPGNFKLYEEFLNKNSEQSIERLIIERLQTFGLLLNNVKCQNNTPECKVVCRAARVVDRLQWACETCGKRQPIREGSFFLRLQCSIPQALQTVLAWCEDADLNVAAEYFGVKLKVARQIYDKLDDLATKEHNKTLLGGDNSVVLAEIFPDCLNRLSPDTTDHPHVHRILMLADTKHIPTYYHLHVLKDDMKKTSSVISNTVSECAYYPCNCFICNMTGLKSLIINPGDIKRLHSVFYVVPGVTTFTNLKAQIEGVLSKVVAPQSTVVFGSTVPIIEGAVPIQQLTQQCDADMQHFLTSRIWKQAITLCTASRDLCASTPLPVICAGDVQRYLDASLYRIRYGDGFYRHMLNVVAEEYTGSRRERDQRRQV